MPKQLDDPWWSYVGMDQYLLIPFLVGWTDEHPVIPAILMWTTGVQGFDSYPNVLNQSDVFFFQMFIHLKSLKSDC